MAKEFPKVSFVIIDSVVELPNVRIDRLQGAGGQLPGRHDGGAWPARRGKVGFVGGMDIPLIRSFQCGYEQGAKYANPKVEVIAER